MSEYKTLQENQTLNFEYQRNKELRELKEEVEGLKKRNKEIYDGFMATTEELCEATKEIERLNNIIERLENEISGAYTDLSNNLNVNYMHEALKKDLLQILGSDKE